MAAETSIVTRPARTGRRRRWLWALGTFLVLAPLTLALISWALTEPIEPEAASLPTVAAGPEADSGSPAPPAPTWPEDRLDGEPAKKLLLAVLQADRARLDRVPGYTVTFRKQERIKGKLGPLQTLALKVRHEPFSVYLKYLAPKAGKEALYVDGQHDGHVIAHNGDWTRRLVPRLKVAPDSPLALADSRHPITEAGLRHLVDKLIRFRELDLADPEAETVLDRTTDEQGHTWLRSTHLHPVRHVDRPFARVVVLFDPETMLPHRITNYDWPEPGVTGELLLAEDYAYDALNLDAGLSEHDFDVANPAYEFTRY